MKSLAWLTLSLAFVLHHSGGPSPDLPGSEPQIYRLQDGTSFEGLRIKESRGETLFRTELGLRRVETRLIASQTESSLRVAEFRERRRKLQDEDRKGLLELLSWCEGQGLTSGCAELAESMLRSRGADPDAWAAMARWSPLYDVAERNASATAEGDRWARKEVDRLFRGIDDESLVRAGLVALRIQALPSHLTITPAIRAAERGRLGERFVGAHVLGFNPDPRRVPTLYRVALADLSPAVRSAAAGSLAQRDDGTTYRPFVRAMLRHEDPFVRTNAAAALAELGDRRGVAPIVRALKATTDGARARSNFQSLTQTAYVKDYDVEVAQTAFIADPVVDVVLDGMVLDVAVLSIQQERRLLGRALGRMTGQRHGADVGAWTNWWTAEGAKRFGREAK